MLHIKTVYRKLTDLSANPLLRPILAVLSALIAAAMLILFYLFPAVRLYNVFWLQTFDYGIFYHSTYLLSRGEAAFMRVRGMHVWADNQDYLQYLFAPLHYLPYPHYALLITHALVIFSAGALVLWALRKEPFVAVTAAFGVWLSPILINMNFDAMHTEACATALLLGAVLAAHRGKSKTFVVLLGLALLSKEDVSITAAVFCLVAAFQHKLFLIRRTVLLTCLGACGLMLAVNLALIKPHFIQESCAWLGAENVTPSLERGVLVHWFNPLLAGFDFSKFLELLRQKEVGLYLLQLFWPLIFVLRAAPALTLLPIPGALVNILSQSPYLIQGKFHYDHSTYAMVLAALILGLACSKYAKVSSFLFLAISIGIMIGLPQSYRTRPIELVRPELRDLELDRHVVFLEALNQELPAETKISADHTSLNYLLAGHADVFMFSNPYSRRYFGVYGLCENPKTFAPVDIIVLRDGAEVSSLELLQAEFSRYERLQILLPDGREQFKILLNNEDSLRAAKLRLLIINAAQSSALRCENESSAAQAS